MSAIPQIEPVGALGARVVYPELRPSGSPWDSRGVAFWTALVLSDGCDAAGCGVRDVLRHLGPELTRIRPDLFPPPAPRAPEPAEVEDRSLAGRLGRLASDETLMWAGATATVILIVLIVVGAASGWWG